MGSSVGRLSVLLLVVAALMAWIPDKPSATASSSSSFSSSSSSSTTSSPSSSPSPSPSSAAAENAVLSVLLALKDSITADPTGFLTSWNSSSSSHYCSWPGILCTSSNSTHTSQVSAILLNSLQLSGILPPQLTDLLGLSYLNVSNNSFTGPIPRRLGDLAPSLTHLDLSGNSFTGSIPDSLASCTGLVFLDFNKNSLTSEFPSYITNFTGLTYLDLSTNFIKGKLPLDFGRLSDLEYFQVYGNALTGGIPESLMNCSKMVWLDLADNQLSGPLPLDWIKLASTLQALKLMDNLDINGSIPSSLFNCTVLTSLSLENMSLIGEIPGSLGQLFRLQEVKLFYNFLSGPIPVSLVNCTQLIFLELSYNNLSGTIPADVGLLSRAQWILFGGNPFLVGTIPDSIGDCAQVQYLSLQDTRIGGSLPSTLFNLTTLLTLRLHGSAFSGHLPEQVSQLVSLQSLDANRNGFEGAIPAGLGELKHLEGLYLQENIFSGPIPPQLSGCISISEMNFSYNPLSGSIPTSFMQLTRLNKLYLRQSGLSGEIPDIFSSLTVLQELDLAFNRFLGPIPASLSSLRSISVLLDLSFNNLTGTISSSVGGMEVLITMILSGNQLTGEIPQSLGECIAMQKLDLSSNLLEGDIPTSLGRMNSLQYLDLSNNKLSGSLPPSLGSLPDLVTLNVSYNSFHGSIPSVGVYKNSSSSSFIGNAGLCGYPLSTNCNFKSGNSNHSRKVAIIASVWVAVAAILACLLCACLWWCFCRRKEEDDLDVKSFDIDGPRIKAWTADEMRLATNGFDAANVLGTGGVSVCYKGVMVGESKGNIMVAFKRLKVGDHHGEEARKSFVNELKTLCKVRHRNLVKVLGYCMEGGEVALVMEYMEKGDLDGHLHSDSNRLGWEERVNVAADVAEGLVYLHHEYMHPIVHCDLKPKNILLGLDMVPKISDFGIAKLLDFDQKGDMSASKFRGTFGYAAPEYAAGWRISTKMDVYSYGVLLLELVTGERPTSPRLHDEGSSLQRWVRRLLQSGRAIEALDASLDLAILPQAQELLSLGVKCTNEVAKERPTMRDVHEIIMHFKNQRVEKAGSKNYRDMEALLQSPDHVLSIEEANKLLRNPSVKVDFDLQSFEIGSKNKIF